MTPVRVGDRVRVLAVPPTTALGLGLGEIYRQRPNPVLGREGVVVEVDTHNARLDPIPYVVQTDLGRYYAADVELVED